MTTTKKLGRTLMLSPWFGPGHFGGIELCAQLAWEAVSTANPASRLLTTGRPLDAEPWVGISSTSKQDAVVSALKQSWQAEQILVWHVGLLKLLPFLRLPGVPVTLMLFGIEIWRPLGLLSRLLLRRVNSFLSISQFTWDKALTFHPYLAGKPHHVVALGTGTPLPVRSSPRSTPTAVMISRLSRAEDYKGHREVIAAWPAVRGSLPEAELWIIGDGDLRPELEDAVAAHGLEEAVRFMGRLSNEERDEALAQSHALLMPSRNEGFGLVYLEAMRLGRPCLVSTVDAGREVIAPPEAGLAVNPADHAALVQVIRRLLSDSNEWQGWSEQSRQRYEQGFTAAHFQKRLLAALGGAG